MKNFNIFNNQNSNINKNVSRDKKTKYSLSKNIIFSILNVYCILKKRKCIKMGHIIKKNKTKNIQNIFNKEKNKINSKIKKSKIIKKILKK